MSQIDAETTARKAGLALQLTAAKFGFGILISRPGGMTNDGLEVISKQSNRAVVDGGLGAKVYHSTAKPLAMKFSAGQTRYSPTASRDFTNFYNEFKTNLKSFDRSDVGLESSKEQTQIVQLAVDLLATSFLESTPIAKFLKIMTTVEVLCDQEPVQGLRLEFLNRAMKVYDKLRAEVAPKQRVLGNCDDADVEAVAINFDRIRNTLKHLEEESIGESIRRHSVILQDPDKIMNARHLYGVRSKITHSGRPDASADLNLLSQQATEFAVLLIKGRLLDHPSCQSATT